MDTEYLNMDPDMLYSLVNTRLRNEFGDVRVLAKGMGIDREALLRRLAAQGYRYAPALNQFRPVAIRPECTT